MSSRPIPLYPGKLRQVHTPLILRDVPLAHGGRPPQRSAVRVLITIAAEAPSRTLLHLAATDTSRADENSAHIAANLGADFLQVGVPAPLGLVVGVADVVADRRMLLAVCAMSHWISDLSDFIAEQPARLAHAQPL